MSPAPPRRVHAATSPSLRIPQPSKDSIRQHAPEPNSHRHLAAWVGWSPLLGASADSASSTRRAEDDDFRVLVMGNGRVPYDDVSGTGTGVVALEELVLKAHPVSPDSAHCRAVTCDPSGQANLRGRFQPEGHAESVCDRGSRGGHALDDDRVRGADFSPAVETLAEGVSVPVPNAEAGALTGK